MHARVFCFSCMPEFAASSRCDLSMGTSKFYVLRGSLAHFPNSNQFDCIYTVPLLFVPPGGIVAVYSVAPRLLRAKLELFLHKQAPQTNSWIVSRVKSGLGDAPLFCCSAVTRGSAPGKNSLDHSGNAIFALSILLRTCFESSRTFLRPLSKASRRSSHLSAISSRREPRSCAEIECHRRRTGK